MKWLIGFIICLFSIHSPELFAEGFDDFFQHRLPAQSEALEICQSGILKLSQMHAPVHSKLSLYQIIYEEDASFWASLMNTHSVYLFEDRQDAIEDLQAVLSALDEGKIGFEKPVTELTRTTDGETPKIRLDIFQRRINDTPALTYVEGHPGYQIQLVSETKPGEITTVKFQTANMSNSKIPPYLLEISKTRKSDGTLIGWLRLEDVAKQPEFFRTFLTISEAIREKILPAKPK